MDKKFFFVVFLTLKVMMKQSLSLPANICDGTGGFGILPHPDNCASYIICVNGIPTIVGCQENEIFNPDTKRCEPGKL